MIPAGIPKRMDTPADPLDVYRMLRVSNPSPYMYLLQVPDEAGGLAFSIVGSSPEALVTVQDGRATTHPIAGTRWRGATDEEDQLLAKLPIEAGGPPQQDVTPLLAMGEDVLAQDDGERAATIFSQIVEIAPDNAQAASGLIRALAAAGRPHARACANGGPL